MNRFLNPKFWLLLLALLPYDMAVAHNPQNFEDNPVVYQEQCFARFSLPFKIEVFKPESLDHMKKYWASRNDSLSEEEQRRTIFRNELFSYLKEIYPTPFYSWVFTSLTHSSHFMIVVVDEMNPLGKVFVYIDRAGPLSAFLALTDPIRTCITGPLKGLSGKLLYSLGHFSVDNLIRSASNLADIDKKLHNKAIASQHAFVEAVPFIDEDREGQVKQFFTLIGFLDR